MITILAAASITMGLVVGWWIIMVIAAAVTSHSQERAQRQVRHWQTEAARARAVASLLASEAAAHEELPSECES
jgi:membrane protein YqaA with SNARE-associated domain